MSAINPPEPQLFVYTYKEGLLSAVAHDLKIRAERFTLELTDGGTQVRLKAYPASLRVLCAMKGGQEDPGTLSNRDKSKIEQTLRKEVLKTHRHQEIRFEGKLLGGARPRVEGTLTLAGKSRPITAPLRAIGERLEVAVEIHQPDFGIKPYSAMMGTLKVQPRVKVVASAKGALSDLPS